MLQGFCPHSFDVILTSELPRSDDINTELRQCQLMLCKGGALVMIIPGLPSPHLDGGTEQQMNRLPQRRVENPDTRFDETP